MKNPTTQQKLMESRKTMFEEMEKHLQGAYNLTTDKNARKLAAITATAFSYGGDMPDEQADELLDDIDFHFNKVKCNKIERLMPVLNQLVEEEMRYIAGNA